MYMHLSNILKKSTLAEKLLFACSVFSTMSIITLNIGTKSIQLFRVFFLIFIVFETIQILRNKRKVCLNYNARLLFLWFVLSFISCVFGMIYYINRDVWFQNASYYAIKTLIYIVFMLFFC